MVKINAQPVAHQIYNEFDRFGQLLDLRRIPGERNAAYKKRLLDVMVRRSNSTYLGLIYGITRELGYRILDVLRITPVVDGNGDPVSPQPAIVFQDTKCLIYSDYDNDTIALTLDRFDNTGTAFTIGELATQINTSGVMLATLLPDADTEARAMTIFNQGSILDVFNLDISAGGTRIVLPNTNLIPGTVSVSSANMTRRVDSEIDVRKSGDYFINLQNGTIVTAGSPSQGSSIRYQYRNDDMIVQASPVIIHNLQSDDFKTKMFRQLTNDEGETYNGYPTNMGADIINELLSVYPSLWGK